MDLEISVCSVISVVKSSAVGFSLHRAPLNPYTFFGLRLHTEGFSVHRLNTANGERSNPVAPITDHMDVFIVEDSRVVASRLKELLGSIEGVRVIGDSGSADSAINQIETSQPDAVILDLHLHEGSGFDVLRSIQEIENPPVVIVLTNYPLPQYRELSFSSGADYFFDKSTQFERVVEVVRSLDSA